MERFLFKKPQKDKSTDFDMVFELVIKNGLDLNSKIVETKIGNTVVYSINDNSLIIITKPINQSICKEIKKLNPKSIFHPLPFLKEHQTEQIKI